MYNSRPRTPTFSISYTLFSCTFSEFRQNQSWTRITSDFI